MLHPPGGARGWTRETSSLAAISACAPLIEPPPAGGWAAGLAPAPAGVAAAPAGVGIAPPVDDAIGVGCFFSADSFFGSSPLPLPSPSGGLNRLGPINVFQSWRGLCF